MGTRTKEDPAGSIHKGCGGHSTVKKWLPRMDSNHDKQIQNLLCYRYTTRQWLKNWSRRMPDYGAGFKDLLACFPSWMLSETPPNLG